jgi:hypothetical protein
VLIGSSPAAFANSSQCDAVVGNLLLNCGFETGSFAGWTSTAANYTAVDNSNPYSGSYAASLGSESTAYLTQTVTDVVGAYYSLSFELDNEIAVDATGTPYSGGNLFYVYYENASGSYFNLAQYQNLAETGTYQNYSFNFYGSGSDTIIFIYDNVPSYFELDDVVFKDPPAPGSASDLSFSPDLATSATPEPSGLALLGTGAISFAGLARRRFAKRVATIAA